MAKENEIGDEWPNEENIPGMTEANEIGDESQNEENIPGMAEANEIGEESQHAEDILGMSKENEVGDEWPNEENIPAMAEANEIDDEPRNKDIPEMAKANEIGDESQDEEDILGMAKENEVRDESQYDKNIPGMGSNKSKEGNKTRKQSFENLVGGNNSFNLRRKSYIKTYGNENSEENSRTRGSRKLNLATTALNGVKSMKTSQTNRKKIQTEGQNKEKTIKLSEEALQKVATRRRSSEIAHITRNRLANARRYGPQPDIPNQSNDQSQKEDMIPKRGKQAKSRIDSNRNESSSKNRRTSKHVATSIRNSQTTSEIRQNEEKNTRNVEKKTAESKGFRQSSESSSSTTLKQAKHSSSQNSRENVNFKENASDKSNALQNPALRKQMADEDVLNSKGNFETNLSMENASSDSQSSKDARILNLLSALKCPYQDKKKTADCSTGGKAFVQKLWNEMSPKTETLTNSHSIEQRDAENVDSDTVITELGELQINLDRESLKTAGAFIIWLDNVPETDLSNHLHKHMGISNSKGKLLNDTDIMQRKTVPDLEAVAHSLTDEQEHIPPNSRLRGVMEAMCCR